MPAVLTIPHDGFATAVGPIQFISFRSHVSNTRPGDRETKEIGRQIRDYCVSTWHSSPSVITEKIQRDCRTLEIQRHFEDVVESRIKAINRMTDKIPFVFDLHGFMKSPPIGAFDIILGTLHRQSVGHSQVDRILADRLSALDFRVYVPTHETQVDEKYTGEELAKKQLILPLLQTIALRRLPVIAIQLEIAYQVRANTSRNHRLVQGLGDFIHWYSQSNMATIHHPTSE